MKNKCCILFIGLMLFCLSGCYSIEEVDTKAYPIAVALDKVGERVELGVQFGKVIKGSEGATPTEEGNIVIKYEGLSFYDAFEKLNQSTSKQLSYSQLKALIVSDSLAQEGIMPLIYSLVNSYHVYPNMYVMVAGGSAVQYLDQQKIWLETTPSKFYELFYDKAYRSYLNVMTISEIAFSQVAEKEELVLPYITYVKGEREGEEENVPLEQQGTLQENHVQSVTPSQSEITRLAIFKDGKMIDFIQGTDVEAYGLIKGNYFKENFSVPLNGDFSESLNIDVQNKANPQKKVYLINDIPHISVKLSLSVIKLSGGSTHMQNDQMEEIIEQYFSEICKAFFRKTQQQYNSDIFGFAKYAGINFQTYQQQQAYEWKKHYKQAVFDIQIEVQMDADHEAIRPQSAES